MKNVLRRKMSSTQGLGLLGEKAKSDVQKKITLISSPPNEPSTRKQKGSSNPLIDTGALRQHINWAKL